MDFVRPVEAVIPGVQGRVHTVLVETTAELNPRTIARLSGVSFAQAFRVLPRLVELGLVERREVPPSSLFRLVREHVADGPLIALARGRDGVIEEMGRVAAALPVSPVSVIVFDSFARGEADAESDIDTVFVQPVGVDETDDAWSESVEQWRVQIRRASGNPIEVLEVRFAGIGPRLGSSQLLWRDIRREGIVVHGRGIDELGATAMPRQMRTRNVSGAQARSYLAKEEEYLAASENELDADRGIAATSLAIHAAINAADAVCGVDGGKRAAGRTTTGYRNCSGMLVNRSGFSEVVCTGFGGVRSLDSVVCRVG